MLKRQRRFRPELGFVADPRGEWGTGTRYHRSHVYDTYCDKRP